MRTSGLEAQKESNIFAPIPPGLYVTATPGWKNYISLTAGYPEYIWFKLHAKWMGQNSKAGKYHSGHVSTTPSATRILRFWSPKSWLLLCRYLWIMYPFYSSMKYLDQPGFRAEPRRRVAGANLSPSEHSPSRVLRSHLREHWKIRTHQYLYEFCVFLTH